MKDWNKSAKKAIKKVEKSQAIHIVIGNISDTNEKDKILFEDVKVAHTLDAAGDLSKSFDKLKEAIIQDIRSYINEN